ncbi:unnamed protein product [Rotaria socialis]|uniref:Transmembrane protein 188 n=1 Tax=Rotaria socialis TaxID=392032 RepID=A0A820H681_9BILA|nr:unnamed protein product [Rotaria socialis]CAF3344860.1 unnamed protein product [Rotaria socialis]CAF3421962.1 unnamed protein product [Rotaria socialis]CAF3450372.1 unnamed protein product [Rotaria socialis]CAF3695393.1 unnamed protein product [Rotaria socialis]
MDQADDLKAFERRMIEIVSSLQPSIWLWRFILLVLVLVTFITCYALMVDLSFSWPSSPSSITTPPITKELKNDKSYSSIFLFNLFRKEIYFTFSFGLLIFTFLFGIHRKMFASSIIIARFRYILADYNMSCDPTGRLVIKPRPATRVAGSL